MFTQSFNHAARPTIKPTGRRRQFVAAESYNVRAAAIDLK
jgi:hypothetical protein